MQNTISKIAVAVLVVNALLIALLPVMADERANRAASDNIYGAGKATLLWPSDDANDKAALEYANGRYLSTFEGTVSRVRSRDYFDFRTDNGRVYRVVGQDEHTRFDVTANQRVVVRGYLTQDILVAFNVRPIGYGGNSQVDFPGTVSSITGVARFSVRGDNGRTYTIDARYRLPYGISAGDYVRVAGAWDGTSVIANQITILGRGSNSGGSGDRYVDFPGTVTDVDRNTISVRGENAITYKVIYNGNDRFEWGDHVRVTGYFDGYNVRANSITRR